MCNKLFIDKECCFDCKLKYIPFGKALKINEYTIEQAQKHHNQVNAFYMLGDVSVKFFNDPIKNTFNQPERSKREDSVYKFCYVLYDYSQESIIACNTPVDVLFSKKEADTWVMHGVQRTWQELLVCKVFSEMRCSEHCGNTVREAQ